MVVVGDISKLFSRRLGKNLIGAVPDQSVYATPEFQEYVEKVVGVDSYKNYFNAGMLLMNLDELRKFKFPGEIFIFVINCKIYSCTRSRLLK